jgi:hypothetical protein
MYRLFKTRQNDTLEYDKIKSHTLFTIAGHLK